jgi:hypothetical protein
MCNASAIYGLLRIRCILFLVFGVSIEGRLNSVNHISIKDMTTLPIPGADPELGTPVPRDSQLSQ